jgi:hypothetical protein
LPAFGRLGLQGGWPADGPPQGSPIIGKAADQLQPNLKVALDSCWIPGFGE